MKDSGKILIAAGAGLLAGAVLGILLAPDKGSETRKKIAEGGKHMADTVKDKIHLGKTRISAFKDRVKEKADDVKDVVEELL